MLWGTKYNPFPTPETHTSSPGKVERGTRPHPQGISQGEGSPVLLLNRAACGDHPGLGAAWGNSPAWVLPWEIQTESSGVWTGNQAAEKLSQITNIMCSPFQNHRPRFKPPSLLVTGKAQSSPPQGSARQPGMDGCPPICPWVSPPGPSLSSLQSSEALRGLTLVGKAQARGKRIFSRNLWVSDFLRPGSPSALRRDNENKAGDPAPIVLRLGR